jgi:hypothetical protein
LGSGLLRHRSLELPDEQVNRRLERQIAHTQLDLGALWRLVRVVDTGELADLAATSAGIEPLRIAPLALRERRVHVHLEEEDAVRLVQLARLRPLAGVRAHETHESHDARVGEESCDVCHAAHVLGAGFAVEGEIAVEAVAQVIAIERYAARPREPSAPSSAAARVDFPEAGSP